MNGAESLVRTAVASGIQICFANPGTTEMPLVAALDAVPGLRPVLGLFEGVCTGAADGYARMTRRPALTLLHLGPGFANGIANLHNARRADSPVVNVIGDHARWHADADAPLSSDIASLARPVSAWLRTTRSAGELAEDTAEAVASALRPPGGVATLIVPADCQWEVAGGPAPARAPAQRPAVDDRSLEVAAKRLRSSAAAGLLLGGAALGERGLRAAARIAAASGCRVMHETFAARLERGAGLPAFERLPYFPEQALQALNGLDTLLLAGAPAPVAFFGYPDQPSSLLPPGCTAVTLARRDQDVALALEALAEALGADPKPATAPPHAPRPAPPRGALTPASLGQATAALLPDGAVVVDEAATSGLPCFLQCAAAPSHSWLMLTGGAIGQGLPCALGAALACSERRVIALQADGSGMYTLQALWTMARESTDVTVVICANRSYRILQVELARAGIAEPGPGALALTDLEHPPLDWVALARGMGVPGVRTESAEDFSSALERSLAASGPSLIEAVLA